MASHETFVPTALQGYINVDGKLMLHQLWITETGNIEWRRVPIVKRAAETKTFHGENYRFTHTETQVFNDNEWGDDGTIRPMSHVLPGD